MNRKEALYLVGFCVDNKLPFRYKNLGESNEITFPHGERIKELLELLCGEDSPVDRPIIRTSEEGLVIT